jgi:uncharacterized protein YjbI with pentapeptide repeats
MTRSEVESALAAAIDADSAIGTPWWPGSEMASIAFRRWSSFARRHKKQPTFEDRVLDLEKGLRCHYEPDTPYSPPGEWLRLARLLAAILAGQNTDLSNMRRAVLNRDGEIILRLDEKKYRGLNFMDMDLSGAVFDGLILEGAYFAGARLYNSSFVKCDLYWASFFQAVAVKADFRGAELRGANLEDANFQQACFDEADLGRDALNGGTQLSGADLTGASVYRAKFDGARYDSRTKFPTGFDPKKHGMKLITGQT